MEENSVPIIRLAIISLWSFATALIVAGWVVGAAAGHWQLGCLLAMSGMPALAGVIVCQVRCYNGRVVDMLRTMRADDLVAAEIHSLR